LCEDFVCHSYKGEFHKGPSSDCPICRRKLKQKPTDYSAMGKMGGKKSSESRKRHCKCGKVIQRKNKSGKCSECYKKWAREKYKQRLSSIKPLNCKVCGKKLDHRNRSGYCAKHFKDSQNYRARRHDHACWVSVNVFSRDVKELDIDRCTS
jgi:hypothetical protein